MWSNAFTMFAGFCARADKNHIYTVLTQLLALFKGKHNADMAHSSGIAAIWTFWTYPRAAEYSALSKIF